MFTRSALNKYQFCLVITLMVIHLLLADAKDGLSSADKGVLVAIESRSTVAPSTDKSKRDVMKKDIKDLTIGVALSGGGFRATLHGLGVLMFLVDSGLSKQVNCIASVSGGSIANGCVATRCEFREVTSATFDGVVGEIAREIVHRGLIPSRPFYFFVFVVGLLLVMSLAALVSTWLNYWPKRWSALAFVGCVFLLFIVWSLRGDLLSYLLREQLLGGSKVTLGDLDHINFEHVFCATDINHGAPVFLSTYQGGKIYSDSHGWGRAGHLQLSDVVRASASYPGGFPPLRLPITRCRFGGPAEQRSGLRRSTSLYLVDGGVWNNLATEWWDLKTNRYHGPGPSRHSTFDQSMETLIEEKEGSRTVSAEFTRTNPADVVLVVNSQASSFSLTPTPLLRIPFLAELIALMRDTETMYENSVGPRLDALEELEASGLLNENRFPVLRVGDSVPPSVPIVIQLNRNYKWGQLTASNSRLEKLAWLREREEAFRKYNTEGWWARSWWNIVPTTLSRFDEETAVQLLIDGYIGAMGGLSVSLGVPLPERPIQERFRNLVSRNR